MAAAALCSPERVIQPDFFSLELLKNTIPNVTGSWQQREVQFKVFNKTLPDIFMQNNLCWYNNNNSSGIIVGKL